LNSDIHVEPVELLRLCSVPGIGSQRIRNLMRRFKTVKAVLNASVRELIQIEGIDKTLAANIKNGGDPSFVEVQSVLLKNAEAELITFWDDGYPPLLRKIADPPILLFVRGNVDAMSSKSIAVVGTRTPSTYGKMMAERFAEELASYDLTIVSGLARGVDTIAHRAVVQCGGRTIAVLGSGVDAIYPEENKKLAEQIMQSGALVSEFPMGAKPDAPHFPRRNRIIAGLSLGALIVEAGNKSGALITADFALEQGREVFALPGNVNNPKSVGCNKLIQQGAKLVITIEDVLEEFGGGRQSLLKIKGEPTIPLNEKEKSVYSVLTTEPQHIDKIAQQCQLPISETLSTLLSLELKNVILQTVGKNFVKQ
jgi:DNA processing protein